MGPKSPSGLARLGAPFSSRYYAQSLEYYGRRNMFYSSVVAAAFATVMLFVALKAGTQYFKERSLLHGAHAVDRILELTIAPQQDKSHRITYSTTVGYAFKRLAVTTLPAPHIENWTAGLFSSPVVPSTYFTMKIIPS